MVFSIRTTSCAGRTQFCVQHSLANTLSNTIISTITTTISARHPIFQISTLSSSLSILSLLSSLSLFLFSTSVESGEGWNRLSRRFLLKLFLLTEFNIHIAISKVEHFQRSSNPLLFIVYISFFSLKVKCKLFLTKQWDRHSATPFS